MKKLLISLVQWLAIVAVGFMVYFFWNRIPAVTSMSGLWVLFFALAIAFTWVEILKWGVTKPFNCVKCMAGWTAFIVAFVFHTPHWYMYLPAGLFVGAIYSAVKMRWL